MADLTTTYLGMDLGSPLVVSPSPLCSDLDNVKSMEDAGAAAIVLHSLFEEQIAQASNALDANLAQGAESFAESLTYFPEQEEYHLGPEAYLDHIRKCKESVGIPIIGSINGVSEGGWTGFAKQMEEAGADAIELNVYYVPTRPDMTAIEVEQLYTNLTKEVKSQVSVPVAVKIGPYFTALISTAKALQESGADALVLFNRFYQPDFDLDELEVVSNLLLSSPARLRLRLRWTAILYEHVGLDLAITGGVHSHEDVIKSMMAGAKVSMTTAALLKFGIGHLKTVRTGLERWLEEREYASIKQMQGSMSQRSVSNPAAFERANYMRMLTSYTPGL